MDPQIKSKFLVTIRLIPVTPNPEFTSAWFKKISFRTLVCFIICYGFIFSFLLSIMFQPEFVKDLVSSFANEYQPFDLATSMIFSAMSLTSSPMALLLVAEAFPKVSEMSMAKALKLPKHFKKMILSFILSVLCWFMICLSEFRFPSPTASAYPWYMQMIYYFLLFVCYLFSYILMFLPYIIVLSWMTFVMNMCKTKPTKGKEFTWAKYCLHLYHKLEQGLGPLFLWCYSSSQIGWIFSLFLMITLPIE